MRVRKAVTSTSCALCAKAHWTLTLDMEEATAVPIIQMKKLMFKVIDFTSWWMPTNHCNPLLEIWFHQKQNQMWNSGKQVFLQYNKGFRKFCLSNIHMRVDPENWVFSFWRWMWWIISNKWFSRGRFRYWIDLGTRCCLWLSSLYNTIILSRKTFFEGSKFSGAKGYYVYYFYIYHYNYSHQCHFFFFLYVWSVKVAQLCPTFLWL